MFGGVWKEAGFPGCVGGVWVSHDPALEGRSWCGWNLGKPWLAKFGKEVEVLGCGWSSGRPLLGLNYGGG